MAKWIEFEEIVDTVRKTKRYDIINKESRYVIGQIKWYRPFRQYSFFPNFNTVYEKTCLRDIADFLVKLMEERRSHAR